MHAPFSDLSDQQWLSVLKRSLNECVAGLPGFPPREKQRHWVGADGALALDEAFQFYGLVKAACGGSINPASKILDFGIGWGRIARFFMKDVEPGNIHGVDISEEALAICHDTNVPAQLRHIDPAGRLPYVDRSFDIVYAYSVFTHLPEKVQALWVSEIARALKPGGLFVATIRPVAFVDKAIPSASQAQVRTDLESSEFAFVPIHEAISHIYGDAVISPDYVRREWARHFEVKEFRDELAPFLQIVVVAIRRSQDSSSG
jgi:SAM-dependent methyltransferase